MNSEMASSNMMSVGQRDTLRSMGGQAMVSGTVSTVVLVCLFVEKIMI